MTYELFCYLFRIGKIFNIKLGVSKSCWSRIDIDSILNMFLDEV